MSIKIVPAYGYPQEVGTLFSEYTAMLIAGDSAFQEYLDMQHYDEEVRQLEGKYGMPYGRQWRKVATEKIIVVSISELQGCKDSKGHA